MPDPWLVAIYGPTGSGKTDLAEALADQTGAQLLNADAFQVYRGLDIGTNKSPRRADYQLLDLVEPTEDFGVGKWVVLAAQALQALRNQNRNAILVGGTGYYLRALLEGYDDLRPAPDPALRAQLATLTDDHAVARLESQAPDVALRTDLKNPIRVRRALERLASGPPIQFSVPAQRTLKIALAPPQADLDAQIARRTPKLIASGWIPEVAALLARGIPTTAPGFRAHGYRTIARLVADEITLAEAEAAITLETRQYSKRQATWMRAEPRLFLGSALPPSPASIAEALDACLLWTHNPTHLDRLRGVK